MKPRIRISGLIVLVSASFLVASTQQAIAKNPPKNSWEAVQPLLNSGSLDDAKKAILITLGPTLYQTKFERSLSDALTIPTDITCISESLKIYLDSYAANKKLTSSVSALARVASSSAVPMGPYGPLIKQYFKAARLSISSVGKIADKIQADAAAKRIAFC